MDITEAQLLQDLQRLKDLAEIERLKYDYCFYGDRVSADDTNRRDKMAALFSDTGVWELVPGVRGVGAAQIEAKIAGMGTFFSTAMHISVTPRIDIQGEEARATYDKLLPCAGPERQTQPAWSIGQYVEEYVRTARGWRIKLMNHRSQFVPVFHPSKQKVG